MLKKHIIDIVDLYIYDDEDKLIAVQENLVSSTLTAAVESAEIRNGRGNSVYLEKEYNKSLQFEVTSNVFDKELLKIKCGQNVAEATEHYSEVKVYTIPVGKKITLEVEPAVNAKLNIVDIENDKVLVETTDYTVTAGEVTFTTLANKQVKIMPYLIEAVEGAEEVIISADKFAEVCKVIAKTVATDQSNKVTDYVEIRFDKCKPDSNFSLELAAETNNGNSDTITLKALATDDRTLGKIVFIPAK